MMPTLGVPCKPFSGWRRASATPRTYRSARAQDAILTGRAGTSKLACGSAYGARGLLRWLIGPMRISGNLAAVPQNGVDRPTGSTARVPRRAAQRTGRCNPLLAAHGPVVHGDCAVAERRRRDQLEPSCAG